MFILFTVWEGTQYHHGGAGMAAADLRLASHILFIYKKQRKQEVEPGYKTWEPAPCDRVT